MSEKKLVRDLMTVGVPTCPPDTPAADIIRSMLARQWEAVVVLDENGHATGVVSQDELVRTYGDEDFDALTAEAVMRPKLPTVPPDIPLTAAAQIMLDMRVRVLFITHHAGGIEYPAAWLTYQHILRHLAGEELENLGIRAAREAPLDIFLRRREEARRRHEAQFQERKKGG